MTGGAPWRLRWLRTLDALAAPDVAAAWSALFAAATPRYVFQRPEVVRAWLETEGDEEGFEPAVALGESASAGRALVSGCVARYRGRFMTRRVFEPVGRALFGYHPPLLGEGAGEAERAALWSALKREAARFSDQALFRFVPEPLAPPGAPVCPDESPVLELGGAADLDELLSRLSANHRGDVRRRLRRLAERGAVTLRIFGPAEGTAAAEDFAERFLPAYEARSLQTGFAPFLLRRGARRFAERLLGDGLARGWGHYAVLRVGEAPVAWHLGFFDDGALYWWVPVHDPTWEGYSPGKVLLALLAAEGIRLGWRRIHFQTGGQRYKHDWGAVSAPLRTVSWHSRTPKGALLSLYDRRRHR